MAIFSPTSWLLVLASLPLAHEWLLQKATNEAPSSIISFRGHRVAFSFCIFAALCTLALAFEVLHFLATNDAPSMLMTLMRSIAILSTIVIFLASTVFCIKALFCRIVDARVLIVQKESPSKTLAIEGDTDSSPSSPASYEVYQEAGLNDDADHDDDEDEDDEDEDADAEEVEEDDDYDDADEVDEEDEFDDDGGASLPNAAPTRAADADEVGALVAPADDEPKAEEAEEEAAPAPEAEEAEEEEEGAEGAEEEDEETATVVGEAKEESDGALEEVVSSMVSSIVADAIEKNAEAAATEE